MIALLCAGSTRYGMARGGRSGGDALGRSELAGLLAGLDEHELYFALAKYACDEDSERRLIGHMQGYVEVMARQDAWKIISGQDVVGRMAALAVFEIVQMRRCPRCHGSGILVNRTCSACRSSGYARLSGRDISGAIGVDQSRFSRLWSGRYERVINYLQCIDSSVKKVLSRADRSDFVLVA